ncbi:MAG TPA: 3-isopropylmalate dehydratase [Candidatus Polarisedimenticolia bacterium]|jgi:3-isopropylmalate/(R)-2-methylmalate dehydratase small subunit|nr:3-isopropylmalate dehydratase [Candidatus Polarisedimenticolia bacterium]
MRGRAHVHSRAGITSDEIVPLRCQNTDDPGELGKHALVGIDAGFPQRVCRGDILVAGSDFGCGSAREHAVWALRGAGIAAVVARSFSRAFFRNALNNGFLVLECPAAVERTVTGDLLEIDLQNSAVRNLTTGEAFRFVPFTPFAMEVLEAGGLLPYVLRQTTGASSA